MCRFRVHTLLLIMSIIAILSAQFGHRSKPPAFDGFCPVSLLENWEWRPGSTDISVVYQDQEFHFANRRTKSEFLNQPSRYAPVLKGADPVLLIDSDVFAAGSRQFAIQYRDRIFIFSNSATMHRFTTNPSCYFEAVGLREATSTE